ncbi:MAG TPA: hypothetical protein VGH52_06060 [Gaiellaceae bacterium]
MSSWDAVRALPLHVDGYFLEPLEREVARDFTLRRTVVVLHGRGEEGRGEEIDYDGDAQSRFQQDGGKLEFAGDHTLESFSLLHAGQPAYRRWAYESAALDLSLKQGATTLAEVLGRESRPLTFVVSTRVANVPGWSELYPALRFKLDADADWTDELIASLPADRIDTVDLKGVYRSEFGNPPNAALYARVAKAFPNAWLEDPYLNADTLGALTPYSDRITWDAAIHEWSDVDTLPFRPQCLNCKPSRFGSVRRLFEFYDRCAAEGIALYGGGQFELGVGREQIQRLASIFHPDGPNDVAPGVYNDPQPRPGLPESPLDLTRMTGFS